MNGKNDMNGPHPDQDRLDAYLLDDLAPGERDAVAAHLRGCARCREAVATLERALQAYRHATPAEPPAGALERLLVTSDARVGSRRDPAWRRYRRPLSLLAAAVAAGAIFMGGFWLGQRQLVDASGPDAGLGPGAETVGRRTESPPYPPRISFNATAADRLQGVAFRDSAPN
jgi:anti-sigma factor RsiW